MPHSQFQFSIFSGSIHVEALSLYRWGYSAFWNGGI